jgi:hypothetical protein
LRKKHINNPSEIFFAAGLYPEKMQKMINAGVDLMVKTMLKLLGKQDQSVAPTLMLKDADGREDDMDEIKQPEDPPRTENEALLLANKSMSRLHA